MTCRPLGCKLQACSVSEELMTSLPDSVTCWRAPNGQRTRMGKWLSGWLPGSLSHTLVVRLAKSDGQVSSA